MSNEYSDINVDNKTAEYENEAEQTLNRGANTLQDANRRIKDKADSAKDAYDKYKSQKEKGKNNKENSNFEDKKRQNADNGSNQDNSKSDTKKANKKADAGKKPSNALSSGTSKGAKKGAQDTQKGVESGTKAGAQTVQKGAEVGTKTAGTVSNTAAATTNAAGTAATVGAEAGEATAEVTAASAPVLPIVLTIVACVLVFIIIIHTIADTIITSSIEAILLGDEITVSDNADITPEAREFEYLFKSFTESSNDSKRSKYKEIYSQIYNNGYSTALYAIWKKVAVDCLYTNLSNKFEGLAADDMRYTNSRYSTYKKNKKSGKKTVEKALIRCESLLDYTYDQYVGRYYLMRVINGVEDKGYNQMVFSPKEYQDPEAYVIGRDDTKKVTVSDNHYHYCNNVIKMCLNSFINPKTNEVYKSVEKILPQYVKKNKDKIKRKGLSNDEIAVTCREHQIKQAIKNLEGEKGPIEKCYVSAEQKKKKKIEYIYLNSYLYKKEGNGKTAVYMLNSHKFTKDTYKEIISYANSFSGNGNASDICELAKEQVGKKGSFFWNNTKYYRGGPNNWCAIFCCWLMEQVGINPADVGWNASCSAWISNARKKHIYHSKENYTPQAGDFIFYDYIPWDGKIASHVGFVADVNGINIHTIEGNATGQAYNESKVADFQNKNINIGHIVGYISMNQFYKSSNYGSVSGAGSGAKNLKPAVTDPNYKGSIVQLTPTAREKIECLVYNENGVNGYVGCLLIAQCIRDAIVDNLAKPETVKKDMGYSASDSGEANEDAKKAVSFIFDKGGYAVKHRILYMYAPKSMTGGISVWHETQLFVIEHTICDQPVKFFDRRF